jgi:hypothetical protein
VTPDDKAAGTCVATVDDLRLIPNRHRAFTVTRARAEREYRLDTGILDLAARHGLPHATGRHVRFDHYDLVNLSLDLGIRSVWTYAMGSWPRALAAVRDQDSAEFSVSYSPTCPRPGHPGQCEFSVLMPGGVRELRWRDAGAHAPVATARFVTSTRWPELPPWATDLIDELGHIRFRLLPPSLQRDIAFIQATGVADCAGVALWLEQLGRTRGLPVRFACGLILAPPFSSMHCWNEVRVDGQWVPIDPLIVGAMFRWGLLDPLEWSTHRSSGAILMPLAGEIVPAALHGERLAHITFPTKLKQTDVRGAPPT